MKELELEKNLKKIKDCELDIELLQRKNEKLCLDNDVEIGKLRVAIEDAEIALEEKLKKSGEDKLECKLGSVSFDKQPDEWKYQDEILMAWIISLPEKLKRIYLKITTTVKKGDLKKQIMVDNEPIFEKMKITSLGAKLYLVDEFEKSHQVEGIEIKHQNPKFSYTIKKLKK